MLDYRPRRNFGAIYMAISLSKAFVSFVVVLTATIEALGARGIVDDEEYMREWRNRRSLHGTFHRLGTFGTTMSVSSWFWSFRSISRIPLSLTYSIPVTSALSIRLYHLLRKTIRVWCCSTIGVHWKRIPPDRCGWNNAWNRNGRRKSNGGIFGSKNTDWIKTTSSRIRDGRGKGDDSIFDSENTDWIKASPFWLIKVRIFALQ